MEVKKIIQKGNWKLFTQIYFYLIYAHQNGDNYK